MTGRTLLVATVAIAARPRVRTPAEARALRRPVVYVNANIRGGEVEGKEAVLALLRDLAADAAPNVFDSLVLLVVPIYNADGNDRFGPQAEHRPEQRGPELVGTRANAQGLDLNRDYVKADAPETRAFLAAWTTWDPDVYVDLHATDGSYHGYALTYAPSLVPDADPYTREVMLPELRRRMRARGYETFDYGNFDPTFNETLTDSVKQAWYTYDARPRFGTNYVGLRGRIAILSEAFSHDPLARRVAATRAFVEEILWYTAARADEVLAHARRGDRVPRPGDRVSVRSRLTPRPRSVDVPAEVLVAAGDSTRTEPGVPRGIRRTGRFYVQRIPVYDRFASALDRPLPVAYVLDAADTAAVRFLAAHGLRVERVERPWRTAPEVFAIDSARIAPRTFQGHRERGVTGRWERRQEMVAAGSYLVRTDQRGGRLAAYLLEAESEDGLLTWGLVGRPLRAGDRAPVRRVVDAAAL